MPLGEGAKGRRPLPLQKTPPSPLPQSLMIFKKAGEVGTRGPAFPGLHKGLVGGVWGEIVSGPLVHGSPPTGGSPLS